MNNAENLPTDNNNKSIVKGHTMYNWETHDAVSYTHLTLPTKLEV